MKACLLFVLLIFTPITFSQNVSPQFSELKGMEDQSGNTHLFYRIYETNYDSLGYGTEYNHIYHFYLAQNIDSLFLRDTSSLYYGILSQSNIHDLDFWNNNPAQYIYCGVDGWSMDNFTSIKRFDSGNNYFKTGVVNNIQISSQNDSLLYAGVNVWEPGEIEHTIKSTDGGWNWVNVSSTHEMVSLNPFDDQIFFAQNVSDYKLYKTSDYGNNFYVVDTSITFLEEQYQYDLDGNHIYRTTADPVEDYYEFIVSDNHGEPFTWASKYVKNTKILISIDKSISGEAYLADGKNIFLSTDFGNNFTLYKSLEKKIVGIYKKPYSDKLYAATKYKIYEIT
ncbi:MAG: hypothetical protein KAI29_14090, partial [Cyclobacteriaceae bacterium]|nr:hypothetical protein [Cyclobacteriaceae bacterium]